MPEFRYRRPRPRRNAAVPAAADGRACGGRTSRLSCALTAHPITAPVVPLMPLGRSTATTGTAAAFIASIMAARQALDRPVETGAEQRVDDHVAVGERCGRRPLDRAVPALRGHRGVALQPLAVADEANATDHGRARPSSRAATKPSPPLLPGPATTTTRRPLQQPAARVGDRAAGILHQLDAGNAAGDGQPVGLRHLGGGQQFDHVLERVSARPTTDNSGQPIASRTDPSRLAKF